MRPSQDYFARVHSTVASVDSPRRFALPLLVAAFPPLASSFPLLLLAVVPVTFALRSTRERRNQG